MRQQYEVEVEILDGFKVGEGVVAELLRVEARVDEYIEAADLHKHGVRADLAQAVEVGKLHVLFLNVIFMCDVGMCYFCNIANIFKSPRLKTIFTIAPERFEL